MAKGNRTALIGLRLQEPARDEDAVVGSRLRTLLELAVTIGRREGLLGQRSNVEEKQLLPGSRNEAVPGPNHPCRIMQEYWVK